MKTNPRIFDSLVLKSKLLKPRRLLGFIVISASLL